MTVTVLKYPFVLCAGLLADSNIGLKKLEFCFNPFGLASKKESLAIEEALYAGSRAAPEPLGLEDALLLILK